MITSQSSTSAQDKHLSLFASQRRKAWRLTLALFTLDSSSAPRRSEVVLIFLTWLLIMSKNITYFRYSFQQKDKLSQKLSDLPSKEQKPKSKPSRENAWLIWCFLMMKQNWFSAPKSAAFIGLVLISWMYLSSFSLENIIAFLLQKMCLLTFYVIYFHNSFSIAS